MSRDFLAPLASGGQAKAKSKRISLSTPFVGLIFIGLIPGSGATNAKAVSQLRDLGSFAFVL
jgi:hypothetical protein